MEQELWASLISFFTDGDSQLAEQWIVLTPEAPPEVFAQGEQALRDRGKSMPEIVALFLSRWREQGATFLLETLPQLLAPQATVSVLAPTGRSMRDLFPDYCRLLDATEQVAILLDGSEGEILVAGGANQRFAPGFRSLFSPVGVQIWAFALPLAYPELERWQEQTHIHLSAQMRQMYLRMGGAPSRWICPYLYGPRDLERGWLFTGLYRDMAADIPISAQALERMQDFVITDADLSGNATGFFPQEWQPDGEYVMYEWDHERLEFAQRAEDFADRAHQLVGRVVT